MWKYCALSTHRWFRINIGGTKAKNFSKNKENVFTLTGCGRLLGFWIAQTLKSHCLKADCLQNLFALVNVAKWKPFSLFYDMVRAIQQLSLCINGGKSMRGEYTKCEGNVSNLFLTPSGLSSLSYLWRCLRYDALGNSQLEPARRKEVKTDLCR